MPGVLLSGGARPPIRSGILNHLVHRMPPADAGCFHGAVRREVCRTERDALHAGRGFADLVHKRDALGGLENGVEQDWTPDPGPGFQLRDQLVGVVDVPGAFHLRDHDDVI